MTPIPLDQISLRSHRAGLWWLGLLYRRPAQFRHALEALTAVKMMRSALILWWHVLPYVMVASVLGRLFLFGVLALPTSKSFDNTVMAHVGEIAFGIAFGIAGGIAGGIAFGIAVGIAFGIAVGIAGGIAVGIAGGIAVLRLYYYPIHLLYLTLKLPPIWYPWHPVAWDDMCAVPFAGLYHLLVEYVTFDAARGAKEIERLIADYPSQRLEALKAAIVLIAREAGRVEDLSQLEALVARLPEGEKGVLSQTRQVRERVHGIVAEYHLLQTAKRPILQQPLARALAATIENFCHQVSGFHEPLSREFRHAASHWLALAQHQLEQAQRIVDKEPSPQLFRAGDPVNRDQEAFITRNQVIGELEQQLTLSTGCPGIILYGRRRVGKSTLLGDLPKCLPRTVIPIVMSMENPEMSQSLAGFVSYIINRIAKALPDLEPSDALPTDLPGFFRGLSHYNQQLALNGTRLILAIDEYESLDVKIGEQLFPIDLLATLRASIQTHRQLIWLFAGSHEITDLPHAPWTSYLVSARTIEVPLFTREETRVLLTNPLQHSSLWAKNASERPRFPTAFWGPSGLDRIHDEAGGWPHLVQLLAETTIDLLNDDERRQVDDDLLTRAFDAAITRGHTALFELMRRESFLPGEWDYLSAFRDHDVQPPPADHEIVASLRRRLLVEVTDEGLWRLRVPLMVRWLKQRG